MLRIRAKDQPRILWLFALLAGLLGCRTIATRESAVALAVSANQQLTRSIKANERDIAQAAILHEREQHAWLDLFRVSREQPAAVSIAVFLRRLEYMAARFGLTVVSVTPSAPALGKGGAPAALVPLPVTILVRGNFRSIVHFLQEITLQKPLTGVESAQIVLSPVRARPENGLDATIRLTLYRMLLHVVNVSAH